MSFCPTTDTESKSMLDKIGVNSFEELINSIPKEVRLSGDLNLPEALSEYEVLRELNNMASNNKTASSHVCFMGSGAYDHFIPSIVGFVLERPEFKTAYTPYQAEVSQGTLQVMFEYQTMICRLTGMDVSNASQYDCGTALAESCFLANAHNKKTEFLIAGTLNSNYRKVMESTCYGKNLTFKYFISDDGTCDIEALKSAINSNTAGIIVQQPNAYGNLEEVEEIANLIKTQKAVYIVVTDPISLGILKTPASYGADIVVAEGQSLGIPMSFGGPYLGIFATKSEFVRKIPGRLSGITQDLDGKRGFVLTLQTREQQIKRDKATSNICTNQGLMMLAASAYLTAMGKKGIEEVATQCFNKAQYLAGKIKEIPGYSLLNNKPFFKEFLVKTPVEASIIIKEAEKEGILAGLDTSRFPEFQHGLLIAVTEMRTKSEMDKLIDILKKFGK